MLPEVHDLGLRVFIIVTRVHIKAKKTWKTNLYASRSARFGFEGFDHFLPEFTLKRIKHRKQICMLPEVHDLDLKVLIISNQNSH